VGTPVARFLSFGVAIALAYVASAYVGFRLAVVAEQITTVWAPTGIALAAVLLGGVRVWPAIWLGAFAANASTTAPLWTAVVIATGNTLEAVAAAWALARVPSFDTAFRRVADVLTFVVIAALACTTISATVGVATLSVAGVQAWTRFGDLWFDWWLGDALGAIIIAPAILTTARARWERPDAIKALAFAGASLVITQLVFGRVLGTNPHPLEYVIFPLIVAAAVTSGPAVTSLTVLGASALTIWHTVSGSGPFAGSELHERLILVQVFMGVLAGTAFLLAAADAERRDTQRRERDASLTLHEADAALRENRDVLSLAMRGGGMGAWSRNIVTNEVWWSRELEEIVGLQPGTFSRTEAGFLDVVHEEDRPAVRTAIDEAVDRRSDYIVEFRFRHASGEWRWMEGRGRAVYEVNGSPRTLYGIGIDVTGRKRAEMALREAKVAAEAANELKDQFLATLSHELRTPLNVILGYARLLQTHAVPAENQQRAFDVIARNAVAQSQLVDDLLDMSRITTGKFRLELQSIPVAAVLTDTLDGVKPAADAKGITLRVDIDPAAGTISADPGRLQQVFWNVLTNALKFTPADGRVSVSLRGEGANVLVTISDTGTGISPEFLPFAFEPFRQAGAGFDRAHGGLGLGLAISRQLVELHGGTIEASSLGAGHGATFTLLLPRMRDAGKAESIAARPDTSNRSAAASLAGVNILLVDDEADTLTLFRDALVGTGAHVRAVANGPEALRELENWQPDVLVTDLGLPGMDGYELVRAIHDKRPDLPAVAVSAYARPGDRALTLAAGFVAHIAKPIDPPSLVRVLATTLSPAD
jgi:PAS domain S-box-containing protein